MSIVPDGATTTRTFTAKDEEEVLSWLDARQGKQNLYFHVNKPTKVLKKKAGKDDILSVQYLHVDVDPRPGEDIDLERERAFKILSEWAFTPTYIIDSGGGFQAFWRLDEPFMVDGDKDRANEIEAYNKQLEIEFGADHCHNVDRVMRLPATVNIPNKKKKQKGRVPAPTLVAHHEEISYDLGVFKQAVTVEDDPATAHKVAITGEVRKVESLEDIDITDYLRMLIVQGHDPDNPDKLPSRSEWMWHVLNEMIRQDMTDEDMYAILLDSGFDVSGHVLDQPHPESYAKRQIAKARDKSVHPWLAKLNDKFCIVANVGNKARVVSELYDPSMKRHRVSIQTFPEFCNGHTHIKVETGATNRDGSPVMKQVGKWWIDHPKHRHYQQMVFAPGQELENVYNLWQGYGITPKEGDCHLFLSHIKENVCDGKVHLYDYLIGWLARCVQQPGTQGEVAVVLRGDQGTGKGIFARGFGSLFGRHFLAATDPKHFLGNFNAHLQDCVVMFADEAVSTGDARQSNQLKTLITEPTLTIEPKGIDVTQSPNYLHILMASNSQWVVPAGANERRYFVLDVGSGRIQDEVYFEAVQGELNNGGREALLHYLLHYDVSDFRVRQVPKTAALREQKELSMTPEEMWWFERLGEGMVLREHNGWVKMVQRSLVQDDYLDWCNRTKIPRPASAIKLGKFLKAACPTGWPTVRQVAMPVRNVEKKMVQGRPWVYEFPPLSDCRAWFDKHYGGPFDWPEIVEQAIDDKSEIPF
jgi:hypothetical protein